MTPRTGKKNKWAVAAVIIFVLAIIGAVTGGSGGGSGGSSGSDTTGAGSACQDYIKGLLKAPDTAKWDGDYTTSNSDGTVTNTGLVSSENGFGALIQSAYTCTLSGSADSGWTVTNGSLDDGGATTP